MSNDNKALAIIPRTVDEVRSLAAMFAKSSLLPPDLRGKEADVFVSIMAGQELGLPPMAALRGVHVVKGKPVLSADSMVGVAMGRGVVEYFTCTEETSESVTYVTKRKGSPHESSCTWTMEDAQRAGLLGNDNWKRYPRAMLKARCKAMLARDVYPDVLAGCYDEDEAREFSPPRNGSSAHAPAPAPDVVDAEIISETPAAENLTLSAIDDAPSLAELEALAPQLTKLPEALKAEARTRYRVRKQALVQQGVPA